jgi:hypothetical protein
MNQLLNCLIRAGVNDADVLCDLVQNLHNLCNREQFAQDLQQLVTMNRGQMKLAIQQCTGGR